MTHLDYEYWLKFDLWPLVNAACLVCGIDPIRIPRPELNKRLGCDKDPLNFAYHGAVAAMKKGEIKKHYINMTEVDPSDYVRWYHSKDHKIPPELERLLESEQDNQEEKLPRGSNLDKQLCQAIGRTLWDIYPDMTIAGMIENRAIQQFGNGRLYKPKTLRTWLSEVDPRPPQAKKGRPRKNTRHT